MTGGPQPRLERRYSVCERAMYGSRPSSDYDPNYRWTGDSSGDDNTNSPSTIHSPMSYGYYGNNPTYTEERDSTSRSAGQTR